MTCTHGPDEIATRGDGRTYCRVCKRVRQRELRALEPKRARASRARACDHEGAIVGGRWRCRECNNVKAREKRRLLALSVPVDGFEAEFGACPPRLLDVCWHDDVAVDRAVSGVRPVGRRLTPLESKEVARIRAEKETLVEGLTWAAIAG